MENSTWVSQDMYSSKFVEFVGSSANLVDITEAAPESQVHYEVLNNYDSQVEEYEQKVDISNISYTIDNISSEMQSQPQNNINDDDNYSLQVGIDNDCEVFYILPRHRCMMCNEIFNVVEHLFDHITDKHFLCKPYKDQCLICGQLFDSSSTKLINHMKIQHNNINPYRCKYCGRRFTNRYLLEMHSKYLHNLMNPYECDICGQSFNDLSLIQNHKIDKHKKHLNCPYCVKCFEKSNDLKLHLNIHVYPEKQYDEEIRDFDTITLKDTITKNSIKLENNQLSDENICLICGIKLEKNYNEHLEQHKNEEYFECLNCCSIFENFNEFEQHVKEHSKLKITIYKSSSLSSISQLSLLPLSTKIPTTIAIENTINDNKIITEAYIPKIHCGFVTPPRLIETPIILDENNIEIGYNNNKNKLPEKLCILCKRVFNNIEAYDNHMKKHNETMIMRNTGPLGIIKWENKFNTKPYQYYCKLCKKYFVLGTTLLLHNKTVHKTMKPYKCSVCHMGFTQMSELRQHNKLHPNLKQYECKLCNMKFVKRSNLKLHQNHHKQKHSGQIYKCHYCGSDCSNLERYNEHIKKHVPSLNNDNDDDDNINNVEIKECEFCEVPYLHLNDLNLHISRVHNVNPQRWECRICNKLCSSATEIIQHNRLIHFGEKPYKCGECNKSFALLHSLVNHKVIHSGNKDYKCEYCDKCFSYASYLKMHMRTHTGERPYICSYCPKTFSRQANLYEHKKQHLYDTTTPYTCEKCGKGYSSLSSFNKHKLLHTGIKSFKCDICLNTYVQKAHLERHMYSHNNEKAFKCDICNKKFKSPFILKRHQSKIHSLFKTNNKCQEIIDNVVVLKNESNKNEDHGNKISNEIKDDNNEIENKNYEEDKEDYLDDDDFEDEDEDEDEENEDEEDENITKDEKSIVKNEEIDEETTFRCLIE